MFFFKSKPKLTAADMLIFDLPENAGPAVVESLLADKFNNLGKAVKAAKGIDFPTEEIQLGPVSIAKLPKDSFYVCRTLPSGVQIPTMRVDISSVPVLHLGAKDFLIEGLAGTALDELLVGLKEKGMDLDYGISTDI